MSAVMSQHVQHRFLAEAHNEVSFPEWLDDTAVRSLQHKLNGGSSWHEAKDETINELADGVIL